MLLVSSLSSIRWTSSLTDKGAALPPAIIRLASLQNIKVPTNGASINGVVDVDDLVTRGRDLRTAVEGQNQHRTAFGLCSTYVAASDAELQSHNKFAGRQQRLSSRAMRCWGLDLRNAG